MAGWELVMNMAGIVWFLALASLWWDHRRLRRTSSDSVRFTDRPSTQIAMGAGMTAFWPLAVLSGLGSEAMPGLLPIAAALGVLSLLRGARGLAAARQ